jgi:hypothetical protein
MATDNRCWKWPPCGLFNEWVGPVLRGTPCICLQLWNFTLIDRYRCEIWMFIRLDPVLTCDIFLVYLMHSLSWTTGNNTATFHPCSLLSNFGPTVLLCVVLSSNHFYLTKHCWIIKQFYKVYRDEIISEWQIGESFWQIWSVHLQETALHTNLTFY